VGRLNQDLFLGVLMEGAAVLSTRRPFCTNNLKLGSLP